MYLQNGYYGGQQLISKDAIFEFTRYQFPEMGSRRAIGFDKPSFKYTGNGPRYASPSSFGHTGFTGIFTWMDPENQLLFIFLSNRVYPTRNNSAISDLNIRPAMHQAIYDAIKKGLH